MKIIPNSDILICGVHSPAGEVVEVKDAVALGLLAQGFARRAPAVAQVETASVEPTAETASAAPARRARRNAST